MSAREAKNPTTQRFGKIDDLLNVDNKVKTNDNINVNTNVEFNNEVNEKVSNDVDINVENNIDKLAALKNKMKKSAKKESNKQVTVYLTPENYKRFNQLKEKGQKSELINQLLDMYFED